MAPIQVVPSERELGRTDDDDVADTVHQIIESPPVVEARPPIERPPAFMLPRAIEIPPKPLLDAARLELIETDHVRIVTDLSRHEMEPLVGFVDRIWPALRETFGPLRDDVPVDAVPLTGFVIRDRNRFSRAGILTGPLPDDVHGQHSGWQFWIRWPSSRYYQRHLFAHECAHCYSMITRPNLPGGWLEAVAEWFATHKVQDGRTQFGVIPETTSLVPGWGRIELLREDLRKGIRFSAAEVALMDAERFRGVPTAYAWAWALATLMDVTEKEAFQRLLTTTTQGSCSIADISEASQKLDQSGLWQWWLEAITYGIDVPEALPAIGLSDRSVLARNGWQSLGHIVEAGESIQVTASGMVVLNDVGRLWESTPRGIRADYAGGLPIGRLLARTLRDGGWSRPVSIGEAGVFQSELGGELFFRVNDHWDDLDNNSRRFDVGVKRVRQ